MGNIHYFDFDVLIEKSAEQYVVRVIDSPVGQANGVFTSPFTDIEIENFLLRFGIVKQKVRRVDTQDTERVKLFGKRLFNAVFTGDVLTCFRSSMYEANRNEYGLRIRMRFVDANELFDLPWEYIYDSQGDRFLLLSNKTPLIRYLDLQQQIPPVKVTPPLNILAMISAPKDYSDLDVDKEWNNLKLAVKDLEMRGLVSLYRLDQATLPALQRLLRKEEFEIFHFIGHGGFDEVSQDGLLLLEDDDGNGHPVSGRFLGTLLHDHPSLRLAVLNTCEGARTSPNDPFAGTAQSLMQVGIPAVIASQFEITDSAAITLANEFYSALADGYPVDAALAEARKAIFSSGNNLEWGVPVLYMRSPDGQIFDIAQKSSEINHPKEELKQDADDRLREIYAQAEDYYWSHDWGEAINQYQSIVAINPDFRDAAKKLEKAQSRANLASLYQKAHTAMELEDWDAALSALEEILTKDPEYRDTSAKLEAVKAQKSMAQKFLEKQIRPSKGIGERGEGLLVSTTTSGDIALPLRQPGTGVGNWLARHLPRGKSLIFTLLAAVLIVAAGYYFFPRPPAKISARGMVMVDRSAHASHINPLLNGPDYWIDRSEVTNQDYYQFIQRAKGKVPSSWTGGYMPPEMETYPVQGVDWDSAAAYCKWRGKRLPSEVEWEFAARGPYMWDYPWGDAPLPTNLTAQVSLRDQALPIDRSFFGVMNLAGGVREWIGQPNSTELSGVHVLRGGATGTNSITGTSSSLMDRWEVHPGENEKIAQAGFRCASDAALVISGTDTGYAFQDTFLQSSSGWPVSYNSPEVTFNYYKNGWYHVELRRPQIAVPILYPRKAFQNFIVETEILVDAKMMDNPDNNFSYGLAIQTGQDAIYGLIIDAHRQTWQVVKGSILQSGVYSPSSNFSSLANGREISINGASEEQTDHLTIIKQNGLAYFLINGNLVASLPIADDQNNTVGFLSIGGDNVTAAHVLYHWIQVETFGAARQPDHQALAGQAVSANMVTPAAPIVNPTTTPEAAIIMATATPTGEAATSGVSQPISTRTPATAPQVELPSSLHMVKVNAGEYTLGSGDLTIKLKEFWVDQFEVTNADFAAFVASGQSKAPGGWAGDKIPAGKENNPVSGVNWDTANQYCKWAKKRLPNEAEWEAAARGPYSYLYPWGNQQDAVQLPTGGTYPVGNIPANRSFFGVYDMEGNAWEWVGEPYNDVPSGQKVARGGSYDFIVDMHYRNIGDQNSNVMTYQTGFRCAADVVQPVTDSNMLLQDDFTDINSGWLSADSLGEFFFGYHAPDFFHLQIRAENSCLSVTRNLPLDNFMMEVNLFTAFVKSDTGKYSYGVTFREQGKNFYAVAISPLAQTWSVFKHSSEGFLLLDEGQNSRIQTGSAIHNRIFVIANGSRFDIFVNGMLVSTFKDSDYRSGNVGFLVRNQDQPSSHIHYDWISVWRLPQAGDEPQVAATNLPASKVVRRIIAPVCQGTVDSVSHLDSFFAHTVSAGESWVLLSDKYKIDQKKLWSANGRDPNNPGVLKIGDYIIIPKANN